MSEETKAFDLMGYAEEEVVELTPSLSYHTRGSVQPGWFALGSGRPADRFFPFSNKEEAEVAKAQAAALIERSGWDGPPVVAFRVRLYADSVKGVTAEKMPNWFDGQRDFHLTGFSSAYRGVPVLDDEDKPVLDENGEPLIEGGFKQSFAPMAEGYDGSDFWAEFNLVADPHRPTYKNKDGQTRTNFVPEIVQFYEDEAAAEIGAGGEGAVNLPPAPDAWNPANGEWIAYAKEIYKAAEAGISVDIFVNAENGVTPELVQQIVDIQKEEVLPW